MQISKDDIKKYLPHRKPFLFIDEVVNIDKNNEIHARKMITSNEYFLEGHFKEQPIFPASIMIEALGQMCVFFLLQGTHSDLTYKVNPSTVFFTACDGIKCRRVCKPGDTLSMSVNLEKIRHPLACFSGEISVAGEKTAHAGEIKLAFDFFPIVDASTDSQSVEGHSVSS